MADGFLGGLRDIGRTVGEAGLAFTTGTPLPQVQQQLGEARLGLQTSRDEARLQSIGQGAIQLKQIRDPQKKRAFLVERKGQLEQAGLPSQDTDEGIELIDQGRFGELEEVTDQAISIFQQLSRKGAASAKAFAPETIRKVVGQDEKGEDITGLFSRQIVFDPSSQTSRVVETRIEGELVTSTGETISQQRAAEVTTAGLKKEAEETGIALGKAKTAPLVAKTKSTIETAVKLAQKEATARGETLTDLARLEAGLPATRQMIDQLRELAPIATSTLGGRAFDFAVKESGFGSTKGADARAKFAAIASNQALPLLREMLGPAFTAEEGTRVLALLGDIDATPNQKMVQLDAFIDGKVRSIQSKQREVGAEVTPAEQLTTGQPAAAPAPQPAQLGQELPEGTIIRNPQTGERLQVVNGQLVPVTGGQ